jgi:hypothetical protein
MECRIELGPCQLGGDEHADQHADHPQTTAMIENWRTTVSS